MEMNFAKFLVFYGSEGCKMTWRFLRMVIWGKLFIYKNPVKSIVAAVLFSQKYFWEKQKFPKV